MQGSDQQRLTEWLLERLASAMEAQVLATDRQTAAILQLVEAQKEANEMALTEVGEEPENPFGHLGIPDPEDDPIQASYL